MDWYSGAMASKSLCTASAMGTRLSDSYVAGSGTGVEKNWQALIAGQSGIARITRFETGKLATNFAGEVNILHYLKVETSKARMRANGEAAAPEAR